MKTAALIAALALLCAAPAGAQKLPDHIGYTIFISGKKVGRSDISVTYGKGTIVFDSRVKLDREKEHFRLSSRTVVDAGSFQVRSMEFEGQTGVDSISGRMEIDGDQVTVWRADDRNPRVKVFDSQDVIPIENFVMEHEIILARIHAASGAKTTSYGLVFPTSAAFGTASVETAARTSIESTIKEAVCDKLIVSVRNAGSFASFYDPTRGLPVYLAFPVVETEVFLDEFHGDEPVSRWVPNEP